MSTLSKHFMKVTAHHTCASFLHPNRTCTHQFISIVWRTFFSMGQFYLPTLVIPLVLKIKSLNREIFIKSLIDYVKSILIGNWLGTITISGLCLYIKIFGFYYPWILYIPLTFGMLCFFYYPEKIKRWQSNGLFNLYIETIIKKSDIGVIQVLRKSRIFGTLTFMGFSAVVLAGFKMTGIKRFWFTSLPNPIKDKSEPTEMLKPCVHDGSCTHHIWKEFSKSSELALIIGFVRFILSNYKRTKLGQPAAAIKLLLQKLDYKMMAFTLSYNTLFKLMYCWFNNKMKENTTKNVMAAGFLSGLSYSLFPNYMLFTFGLTTTLQTGWFIYWKYMTNRAKDSKSSDFIKISSRFVDFVNSLPIAVLVMSGSLLQLVRYRVHYPYATPVYVHNFISMATSKCADPIILLASEVLLGISHG